MSRKPAPWQTGTASLACLTGLRLGRPTAATIAKYVRSVQRRFKVCNVKTCMSENPWKRQNLMFQSTACHPDKWEKLKVDFMYEYIYIYI